MTGYVLSEGQPPELFPGLISTEVEQVCKAVERVVPSVAVPLSKVLETKGVDALPVLGFLDQIANAIEQGELYTGPVMGTAPLLTAAKNKSTGCYYPPDGEGMPYLAARDAVVDALRPDSPDCYLIDDPSVGIVGAPGCDYYAWTTRIPYFFIVQAVAKHPDGKGDTHVSEYLCHLPDATLTYSTTRILLPSGASPYGQDAGSSDQLMSIN